MKVLSPYYKILSQPTNDKSTDLGILILRVTLGAMMLIGHGWGKLAGFSKMHESFPDPLGVGSTLSLSLAVGAEVFCSIALIIGLLTRAATIPLAITMLVAAFLVHADDPWAKKEFAILYLIPFICLFFTGAGRHSLDEKFSK